MDQEDDYSPSQFYYPEDLQMSNKIIETETGIGESQNAIDN